MPNLKTPADIRNLPQYVDSIPRDKTLINRVIDYYFVKPRIKCSLCGTPHNDGYIVELTDGQKTNIGNVCGASIENFERERDKFNEHIRRPLLTKKVSEATTKIAMLQWQLEEMRHKADALLSKRNAFAARFPIVYQDLVRRAGENRRDVYESVQRSKEAIDDALAANPYQSHESLRIEEKFRGTIAGYKFLSVDWSFEHGIRKVFHDTPKFLDIQPQKLEIQELNRWANWSDDYGNLVRTVAVAIQDGEQFLTKQNFELFAFLPPSSDIQQRLRALTAKDLTPMSVEVVPTKPMTLPISTKRASHAQTREQLSNKERRRLLGKRW
ncbi:hypothetical protein [Noviherbaspirillum sp.]|uniref:hypothetical protein n=1 Tax=Noviherbaspirillum sp. TaxID=1926288 RepID=UPI002FE39883